MSFFETSALLMFSVLFLTNSFAPRKLGNPLSLLFSLVHLYPTFLVCPVCFAANFWKVHFFWKPSKEIFIHLATFSKLFNVSMPTVFLGIAVTASGIFKWKFSRHKTPPPYTHYNMGQYVFVLF